MEEGSTAVVRDAVKMFFFSYSMSAESIVAGTTVNIQDHSKGFCMSYVSIAGERELETSFTAINFTLVGTLSTEVLGTMNSRRSGGL